jgi:hypothetical protein
MAPPNVQAAPWVDISKPVPQVKVPRIATEVNLSNMAPAVNDFSMSPPITIATVTTSDSGTDVFEYTPPGSDEHPSPKAEPREPNKDTDIGRAELRQLFGVGDGSPFVKASPENATAYAASLEQTLRTFQNMIADPLQKNFHVVLRRHWVQMHELLRRPRATALFHLHVLMRTPSTVRDSHRILVRFL